MSRFSLTRLHMTSIPLICTAAALAAGLFIVYKNHHENPTSSETLEPNSETQQSPVTRQIAEQVPLAKKILADWRKDNPGIGERKLHIVYWTPADKEPAERYQERLQMILEDIQQFYFKQMARLGFKNHGIKLDYDDAGKLKIHFVRGQHTYDKYGYNSGYQIRQECLPTLEAAGIDGNKETIGIFCNMTEWNEKHRIIRQTSPYYALGTNTEGTAWQSDSPILDLKHLTEKGQHLRAGNYGKISLGKYNTIFIGGIAHELGHALSLPHNCARADEAEAFGVALMGAGNRTYRDELRGEGKGTFLTLAHGLRLASHPIFSGHTARMHEDVTHSLSELDFENHGKSFTVSGNITGSISPYAVLAYMDPEGGGDYNATTTSAIPDADGNFNLHCAALHPGSTADLNLVFLFANGKATSYYYPSEHFSYPYSVAKDGTVDLSTIQTKLALEPVIAEILQKSPDPLAGLLKDCSESTKQIAQRLVASKNQARPLPKPSLIDPTSASVILTDCAYETAQVGYGIPVFDRTPEDTLVLSSGGKIFSSGVFAHANSKIRYQLNGKWKQLNGFCGIADNSRGSVGFQIKGDGKTLFTSATLKGGMKAPIKVDLTGVQNLELITTDGGDGIVHDWSQWLDLKLTR